MEKPKQTPKETPAQLNAKAEYVRKIAVEIFKTLKDSNFKELQKLDPEVANNLVYGLKNKLFENGDSKYLGSSLKSIIEFAGSGKSLNQRGVDAISAAKTMLNRVKEQIKTETQKITKERNDEFDKYMGKNTEEQKKSAKQVFMSYAEDDPKWSKLSKESQQSLINQGTDIILKNAAALRKQLMYDSKAWDVRDGKQVLINNLPGLGTYNEIKMSDLEWKGQIDNLINREALNQKIETGEDKSGALDTMYLSGRANVESKETQSRTVEWVKKHIVPNLSPGKTLVIKLTAYTSVEGSKAVNDRISNQRAEAKKRAIYTALKTALGANWRSKGNVEFFVTHSQIQPEMDKSDIPDSIKDKYSNDKLSNVLSDLNKLQGEKLLYAAIKLLTDNEVQPQKVLSEYNQYISIRTTSGSNKAEQWLKKNSLYLKDNPDLLKYLHKYVGRSRSTEVNVAKVTENPYLLSAQENLYQLNNIEDYRFNLDAIEAGTKRTKKEFVLESSTKPSISVKIDPASGKVMLSFEQGRTISVNLKSSRLLDDVTNAINNETKALAQKMDRGLKNLYNKIRKSSKIMVAEEYQEGKKPSIWTKKLKIYDISGRDYKGEISPSLDGKTFAFHDASDNDRGNFALAQITEQKVDQMFA